MNDDGLPDDRALAQLPFRMAGRLPDDVRESAGEDADSAQWDLLVTSLAGAVIHRGLPVTADEIDLLNQGLRWLDEEEEELVLIDRAAAVSAPEIDGYLLRWRFLPSAPAGDARERAAVAAASELPGTLALLVAWRVGPDGVRSRVYCVVCGQDALAYKVWGRVHRAMVDAYARRPAHLDAALEVVRESETWPAYHRRLVAAARPAWERDGAQLDLHRLLDN